MSNYVAPFADKDIPSTKKFGSAMVYCPPKPVNASTNCNSTIAPCLYNIKKDPCEFYNIAPWNQGESIEPIPRVPEKAGPENY